ncbi:MAG: trimethylamine methyltransferase family protein [Candidatus Bathyarchaeota archaeon]|nr:MAG: trimethylamine methyltransferase family protein [Candidatus Bathyarchaeota archaeon]
MARGYLAFLSEDEVMGVHETSLKILEEIGIKVLSKKVRDLLGKNGAEIDAAHPVVKIPKSLARKAIKKAPKEITLCGRESAHDLKLPSENFPFATLSGFSVFMRDFRTGEKRATRKSDLREFAIVGDYLEAVDFFWPIVTPTEVPPPVQMVHGLAVALEHTGKHVQYQALSENEAKWQISLASAIVGGEKELRRRPIFSTVQCPVSPLQYEAGMSEAMVMLARAGIPISPMSMALSGATAPATIAGTLAIINTENLGALIIAECANPGAPIIYCAESTPADMRTGEINYAAPELPLISAGCAQMAKFYGLPSQVASLGMDEAPPDLKSLSSAATTYAFHNMCRTDLTGGFGSLEAAESAALEQVILDVEAWEHARALLRSFEVNGETLAFDAIRAAGPGGSFLGLKHTLHHFRREMWLRNSSETFVLPSISGSPVGRAKRKVSEILSTHTPPPIMEDVRIEMNRIIKDCEEEVL